MSPMPPSKEVDVEKYAGSATSSVATSPTVTCSENMDFAIQETPDAAPCKTKDIGSNRPPSGGAAWLTKMGSKRHTVAVKVRTLKQFKNGYANLAAFKNSDDDFAVYRRFGYLQARILLNKQDQLRVLAEKLDAFDTADNLSHTRKFSARRPDQYKEREALLSEIEEVFTTYATLLQTSQAMLASNRPTTSEIRNVRNHLGNVAPVVKNEMEYIQHHEDLVTLRAGRDHALLDRCIESCLHGLQRPLPFVQHIFASRTTRMKASSKDQVYYTRGRIDVCASLIIMLVIIALLIVPIYLLYRLVSINSDSERVSEKDGTAICIGILLVFTLLFSAVLSVFTRAKRHEILGAAAAYCAVLVVFLGNVPAR